MARSAPRHDRDAGGPADLLAAKAALRQEVWTAMRAAKVGSISVAARPPSSGRKKRSSDMSIAPLCRRTARGKISSATRRS